MHILDTRTGRELWQVSLDYELGESAVAARVTWHPDETQVTIGFKNNPALLVVDLFKVPELNADEIGLKLSDAIRLLDSNDFNARKRGVYAMLQAGAEDPTQVGTYLAEADATEGQKRLIILVLEWMAREGNTAAHGILKKQSATDRPIAETATSALVRLNAGRRATSLAKEYAKPQPFPWIASEKTIRERQDQIARFDADGDGKLSENEVLQAAEAMMQSIADKGFTGKWKNFDTNKNGLLDQGEREKLLVELTQRLTR